MAGSSLGNGEAIAANKVHGIRCALCWNETTAELARRHNDANVLSIGERMVSRDEARAIVDRWLKTDFDGQQLDLTNAPVGLHATPIVAGNIVLVGAAFETGANPKSRRNVRGASAPLLSIRSTSSCPG